MLLLLAMTVFVGVGLCFYMGWFNFSARNLTGKSDVTLSVDKFKIEADKDRAVDKIAATAHKL